ncbi:endolytic transglycosylase MltG [Bacteroidota bacterium]
MNFNWQKILPKNFSFQKLTKNDYYTVAAFLSLILIVFLCVFCSPNYYDGREPIRIEIQKGAGLSRIVDTLYNHGIIPSKTNLKIAAFLFGAERRIKAGRYEIPNGLSYFGLVKLLLEGQHDEQELVTIPEGIWPKDLAHILKRELNVDSIEFLKLSTDRVYLRSLGINANTAEGYLLPETYYLYTNSTADEIIRRLKREMDKIFTDSVNVRMKELKMNRHQILTLASIIDGESNIVSEYKRISGVYHNRLRRRIALQADPTIQYLKRDRRHNRIFYKDLEINSPYNTYMYAGLPPGPINNPGKDAIFAALYPEEHNYYYFVADGTGGHVFAKNISEHNRNVSRYRRWRARQ